MVCANKKYDLFVTRYDEITEQGIVPADLTIPDWFASTLADALETGPDKVHHKMVLCLLSTKIPVPVYIVLFIVIRICRCFRT